MSAVAVERQPMVPCDRWLMRCGGASANECTIPLVDATNAALCAANVAFLAHMCQLFVRESRITHPNYALLRFSWTFACSLISVSTLLQSLYRLYVTYSMLDSRVVDDATCRPYAEIIMVPHSRSLLAVCYVGSDLIRSLTIIMPMERAMATFRRHDYEANASYLVVGPLLVVLTCMIAIPVAFSGAYGWISVTAVTALLLSMDAAGFSMTCAIMWLNRRLKMEIGRRLSQRYQVLLPDSGSPPLHGLRSMPIWQVSENIRLLTQMRALSTIEVVFQSLSILFVAYSYVSSPATFNPNGPFVSYTVSSTLNAYVTVSLLTLFYYHYRKHRRSRCDDAARTDNTAAVTTMRNNDRRATATLDCHFAALRSAWGTTNAVVVKA